MRIWTPEEVSLTRNIRPKRPSIAVSVSGLYGIAAVPTTKYTPFMVDGLTEKDEYFSAKPFVSGSTLRPIIKTPFVSRVGKALSHILSETGFVFIIVIILSIFLCQLKPSPHNGDRILLPRHSREGGNPSLLLRDRPLPSQG